MMSVSPPSLYRHGDSPRLHRQPDARCVGGECVGEEGTVGRGDESEEGLGEDWMSTR